MTGTPAARASDRSGLTFGIEATQRGLRCALQVWWLKSSIRSAVVFLSTVTAFSAGGGGACTDAHSSMIVSACTPWNPEQPAIHAIVARLRITKLRPDGIYVLPLTASMVIGTRTFS